MVLFKKFSLTSGALCGMGLIRTLLAISVLISHTGSFLGYNIANGFVAVPVFYMFSGFYMFLILTERYTTIGAFYTSRFLRLYPTYLLVFIFALSVSYFFAEHSQEFLEKKAIFHALTTPSKLFILFTNICVFFQDIVMFLAINPDTGTLFFTKNFHQEALPAFKLLLVPQAWTIGVELTFYLLAPFFVRRKTLTLLAFILVSLSARFYLKRYGFQNDPWNYRFFPFELVFFLFGGIGYRMYLHFKEFKFAPSIAPAVLVLALLLLFCFQFLNIAGNGPRTMLFYAFIGSSIPFIFYVSRNSTSDRIIGELSYPIYLTHHIIWTCFLVFQGKLAFLLSEKQLLCVPVLLISVLVSWGINKYVQRPIDDFRHGKVTPASTQRVAISD